uniref:Uncharacterized protein n=1 Tax=Pipistrellus kuhlii TaxID=59472 RepID=A0A7J8A7Y8_PIPKU|nr:hypothetical protein mPipKuh1_008845 [Pipistrellus kuhlii]
MGVEPLESYLKYTVLPSFCAWKFTDVLPVCCILTKQDPGVSPLHHKGAGLEPLLQLFTPNLAHAEAYLQQTEDFQWGAGRCNLGFLQYRGLHGNLVVQMDCGADNTPTNKTPRLRCFVERNGPFQWGGNM